MTGILSRVLVLILCGATIGTGDVARAGELDALVAETEQSVLARYADLISYRKQVEAGAYVETIRLCGGYRAVRGLGPGPVAGGDWTAWAAILGQGAAQPVSAIFGLKADFAEALNLRQLELTSWFKSVHTMYLINSPGFKSAAAECLGVGNQSEIDWFAAAIVDVDVAGTVATEVASLWPVGKVLGLLIRATKFAWGPPARVIGRLRTRISKRAVVIAGLVVVPIGGGAAVEYLEHIREGVDRAKSFVDNIDAETGKLVRIKRIILMSNAIEELARGLDKNDLSQFETWAKEHVTAADRADAHRDYDDLRENGALESEDAGYAAVLKGILPVLDQLNLT